MCFEKRLVVAHDLCQPVNAKGSAYGELGEIHALLGNYEQAASCLEHQLQAARCVINMKQCVLNLSSTGIQRYGNLCLTFIFTLICNEMQFVELEFNAKTTKSTGRIFLLSTSIKEKS